MTATNDITGDRIVSKTATDAYRNHYDEIFNNPSNKVYIERVEGFYNIIVDYHDNPNCFLRLNRDQFMNLKDQILRFWNSIPNDESI